MGRHAGALLVACVATTAGRSADRDGLYQLRPAEELVRAEQQAPASVRRQSATLTSRAEADKTGLYSRPAWASTWSSFMCQRQGGWLLSKWVLGITPSGELTVPGIKSFCHVLRNLGSVVASAPWPGWHLAHRAAVRWHMRWFHPRRTRAKQIAQAHSERQGEHAEDQVHAES